MDMFGGPVHGDDIIHVIDGDAFAREATADLLRRGSLVFRTYVSARAFLTDPPREPGGCILAEQQLPDGGALQLMADLQSRHIALPVIVMATAGTIRAAVAAMRAGAVDYLEKPLQPVDLLAAVEFARRRSRQQAMVLAEQLGIAARLDSLSTRERQVLDALIAGRPNKIIAYELGISIRTIEIYRAKVMEKMKAASLPELIRMAIAAGQDTPRGMAD